MARGGRPRRGRPRLYLQRPRRKRPEAALRDLGEHVRQRGRIRQTNSRALSVGLRAKRRSEISSLHRSGRAVCAGKIQGSAIHAERDQSQSRRQLPPGRTEKCKTEKLKTGSESSSFFCLTFFCLVFFPRLRRKARAGASSAALSLGSAFAFVAAPFVHPVADPIAQFFGIEIHSGAPARELEPGGEPTRPEFLFHLHFVF